MAKSIEQILDELADKLSPSVRAAFLRAIADITDTVILKDLVAAVEAGDFQRAFKTLGMSQPALRPLIASLENVFETGGVTVGQSFPKVLNTDTGRAVFRFDVRSERAEDWIAETSSRLITNIQEDARVNIMNVMQIGVQNGVNPRTTALDIIGRVNPATGKREGGIIGLNQQQELWVRNARRDLETLNSNYFNRTVRDKRFDSIVRNAIETKTPLTVDQIDKLISRYKSSLLRSRGETIARTETIPALNAAQHEAIKQAVDMGAAKQSDIEKIWDTAGDSHVRHNHVLMDGQTVGLDEPFVAPDGDKLMYPGDTSLGARASEIVRCRCRPKYRIDWLSDLD